MKHQNLNDLFLNELQDMYSAENQIAKSLPKLVKSVTLPDLKSALSNHLKETNTQITRLETIFSILKVPPQKKTCKGMAGIIAEVDELITNAAKSPTLDAAIISATQKIEHYEIASYGALRSFAKHLGLNSEITDLLQDTLDEESGADKKLTTIADGSFFSTGVNQEAAESITSKPASRRKPS